MLNNLVVTRNQLLDESANGMTPAVFAKVHPPNRRESTSSPPQMKALAPPTGASTAPGVGDAPVDHDRRPADLTQPVLTSRQTKAMQKLQHELSMRRISFSRLHSINAEEETAQRLILTGRPNAAGGISQRTESDFFAARRANLSSNLQSTASSRVGSLYVPGSQL